MRHTVTSELDPELFAELERERSAVGLSRSAGVRQTVEWWIAQRKEHGEERVGRLEKRHRQVMRRFDYLVGMIREQERLLGISAAEPSNGSGGHHVESTGPQSEEAGAEDLPGYSADGLSGESPLAEARKRARRRVE
jgi:hypothetical protein